jgi:hypothetical protein
MKDEALKLALDALDIVKIHFTQNRHVNEAITAIKQARALDKKAENARELGLDYEPVAWMYPDDYERMLTSETFCTVYSVEVGSATRGESSVALYTTPPAQPAVPDAFGTREGEHPQYIQGWNDCRAEMLKGRTE